MKPEHREPDPPEEEEPALVILARYSGHGLTIAMSTALFLLAGWWVDGRLGTEPLFTIMGALLGAAAGFYSMLQHVLLIPRQRERDAAERDADRARRAREGRRSDDDRGSEGT